MTESEELGPLTPVDMAQWLRQEIREICKASELRIQDATDFVTGYLTGQFSEQQMEERRSIYNDRWGDSPLYAVGLNDRMTNEEIIRRLDRANAAAESGEYPTEHRKKVDQRGGGRKRQR